MFSVKELIDVGPLPHGRGKFGIFVSDVTLAVKDPKSIKRLWTAREGSGYIGMDSSGKSNPKIFLKIAILSNLMELITLVFLADSNQILAGI